MTALIAEFLTLELAAAIAITGIAGLIRGFTGFGAPLVMAPVLTLLYGPTLAVPAIVMMEIPTSVQLVPKAVRETDRPLVLTIGGASSLFAPLGAYLLAYLDPVLMRRIIAVVLVCFVGALLSGWRYRGPRPFWASFLVGALSGVMKGATSFGGPPVLLYLLSGAEAAIRHRSNLIMMIAIMNVFVVLSFWLNNLLTLDVLSLAVVLLPVLMAAVWVGSRLFAFADEWVFRTVALLFLLAIGLLSLFA